MANSNKNIVIIPNINQSGQPNIAWTGNAAYAMTTVVADDNSLFWQNPTGQLFSIANNVTTGTIFAVSDISGIPFVTVNASGNIALVPLGGANVGIGTSTPTALLHIGTGSANVAPILMTSNVVALTTVPQNGAIEFDGNVIYATGSTVTGRGYIPTTQFRRMAASAAATAATITSYFGVNANVTLVANSVYEAEYELYFTKSTAGTVTFTLASSVAPAILNARYIGSQSSGGTVVGTPQIGSLFNSTATAAALPVTNSLTTGTNFYFNIKSLVETGTTNGTLVLNVTNSAGSVTPLRGSYFKVNRVSTANVGIFS